MDVKTAAPQFRGIPELEIDRKLGYGPTGKTMSANGKLERRIVWNLLKHLEVNGWVCKIAFDGDCSYKRGNDGSVIEDYEHNLWTTKAGALTATQVMEIVFNLDEVSLRFGRGDPKTLHGVYLVLGNGVDLLCDWNYGEGDEDGFNAVMEAFDTEKFA